jgi:hypothetical protein
MAPHVAELLAGELNQPQTWAGDQIKSFTNLAAQYTLERTADNGQLENTSRRNSQL